MVTAGRLVDHVYRSLRNDILTNRYAEGEPISEVGVASLYDIARPTARAAVERLIGDGLLTRSGYKAASVPVLTESDIEELYDSRSVLESFIHRGLAQRQVLPPEAIAANGAIRSAAARGDSAEIINADITFHRSLLNAYGNSRMIRMHWLLMGEAHLCMAQVQAQHALGAETIADEHEDILNAISSGDETLAEELTHFHLNHAKERLLDRRKAKLLDVTD